MIPPPPPSSVAVTVAAVIILYLLPLSLSSCPPFPSSPPHFPFSPPFQLHCSSNISINNNNSNSNNNNNTTTTTTTLLRINNLTFSLLHLTSPTSLLLRHVTTHKPDNSCSYSSNLLLSHPISFSNSPFTVSPSTCFRLSLVTPPCSVLRGCHLTTSSPSRLLPDCPLPHPLSSCSHDVLSSLEDFLSTGIEVEWDPQNCTHCKANKTKCGFDPETKFICSQIKQRSSHAKARRRKIGVLGKNDPTVLYLHRHRSASPLPPVFTYEELEMATNRFDLRRKIGDGGFGSVFLGQLYDGRIVAVKHLHRRSNSGTSFLTKSFCNEILILSSIEHPNLVKLHGYCSDTRGLVLVYDYVSNGTLFEHLHKRAYRKAAMSWHVRVEIALQVALAIEYLHFSVLPPIVHRDITSSNIFVEKDMRIKVGDFGLSRLLVFSEKNKDLGLDGCVWTGPQGTPGYLDPDYHQSFRLTEKSDVYSFGVVLLELVTGMKAVDQRREKREVALAEMMVGRIQMGLLNEVVDPALVVEEGVGAVAELAFRCVAMDKDDRPDAREVVAELRRICIRIRGVSQGLNSMNVVVPNDGV